MPGAKLLETRPPRARTRKQNCRRRGQICNCRLPRAKKQLLLEQDRRGPDKREICRERRRGRICKYWLPRANARSNSTRTRPPRARTRERLCSKDWKSGLPRGRCNQKLNRRSEKPQDAEANDKAFKGRETLTIVKMKTSPKDRRTQLEFTNNKSSWTSLEQRKTLNEE